MANELVLVVEDTEKNRRTGKREQAPDHLTAATTMYREMDMTYWLEKAEAEMRELG